MNSAKSNLAAALAAVVLTPLLMAADPDAKLITGGESFPAPAALPAHASPPDPLVTFLGHPVKTREDWEKKRAPELRALFQHYMYGRRPRRSRSPSTGKVIREDKAALGGKATLREVLVECGLDRPVHLLIVFPNAAHEPAACFLGMNFNGNYALLDDPLIQMPSWVAKAFPTRRRTPPPTRDAARTRTRGRSTRPSTAAMRSPRFSAAMSSATTARPARLS